MEKLYDLSVPQKSILLTDQYYTGTSINNIGGGIFVHEKIDFGLFKQAINNFVKYNDSFRIRLKQTAKGVKQYIEEFSEFDIDIIDLNDKSELADLDKKIMYKSINIFEEKLFEFTIFRLPNNHGGYVLKMHHLISDGWTSGLLCRKIMADYSNLVNGINDIEPEIFSYTDYLNKENEYFSSAKFQKDKAYWKEKFETLPSIASIPSVLENSTEFSCEANRSSFVISKKEMEQISNYCSANAVSVFNFFMAVLATYVYKINNDISDFVLGTPILNRSNVREKNTSGAFINIAPLRISFENIISFENLISAISKDSLGLLRHQKYPYQSLLESLRKKDSTIPNLYNIVLSYQITRSNNECSIPYDTRWSFNGCTSDDIDIHLYDMDEEGILNLSYDYKISKYTAIDIEHMHERLMHMINQILKTPNIQIKDIEIVTPREKNQILHEFNNTQVDFPKDKTVVDLFEEMVEKYPDNIAVSFNDEEITYKELNEKANQLAWYLKKNGVKKNSVVALRMHKRLEMIIGILAIIKCDACYLPINMSYPQERVDFMLKDSNAQKLLCIDDESDNITISIEKLDICLKNNLIYNLNKENPRHFNTPEDLIYIIYTSGSTGTPKGAMLCHRNVVRLFKNNNFLFDFNEKDVWTMFHSVAFDFSVWEMYGALLFGGKLVLVSDETAQDPNLFIKLLKNKKVTVLNQTPTYFYNLQKEEISSSTTDLYTRYIIFGGEALKPNLIKPWKEKYPHTKFINMYGITETTVHVTYKELLQDDFNSSTSNIGTPIPTLQVIILDKNQNLMPLGFQGEMCIVGEGIFKGYLNRPELNNSKLINLPLLENKLIYRSGDTAIMHNDGHLEYIGRIDRQVKIRGFRIELGEIEEKILQNTNIDSCIVTKKTDNNNKDLLCAYYIENSSVNIEKLRINLQQQLPNYMIPQYFIKIDKIPININGKTDLKALPTPQLNSITKNVIPARNNIDTLIINAFKSELHITNIGINDSFFDLGGDSLAAINIALYLTQKSSLNITVKDILANPIIENLSDFMQNYNSTNITITATKEKEFYPASSAQKRIYYASKTDGDTGILYNVPGALVFDKIPDVEKLKKCFEILFERHESLRTYFKIKNDNIVQKIAPNINFKLEVQNSTSTDTNYLLKQFVKHFKLSKAPLFRAKLVIQNNEFATLLVDMHHIISDGTSVNILLSELSKLYNDKKIPEKVIDYKDFSEWENSYFESYEFKNHENYWLQNFSDELPVLNMPTSFPRPVSQSFEGTIMHFTLDKSLKNKIEKLSKELGSTPYMFLLSAYYILLYKYTNQTDIIVGTPVSGRNYTELSNVIGMFVNSIPLRTQINSNVSFKTFLNSIKKLCLSAFDNQDYPFDYLVNKLDLKRNVSRSPIFDTMFIYQNFGEPTLNFKNINTEFTSAKTNISKFDFSLEIMPKKQGLDLRFEYCTKLFDEKFIERLAKHYIKIITDITSDITTKISNISILSNEEKNQILYDFNNTTKEYNMEKNIQDIFEEHALNNPDKTAIIFEEEKITYRQLNEKANQIANYILQKNIKSNTVIGIMLPRSIETITCILGILKSGNSYMLIDSTLPKDRIEYMLNNCNTSMLLTKSNEKKIDFDNISYIDKVQLEFFNILNPNVNSSLEDNLSVVYTSGSTGTPKGIIIKRQSMINLMESYNAHVNTNKYDIFLSTCSISFDIFPVEVFSALYNGKTLILANDEESKIPTLLSKLITDHKIEYIYATPSKLQLLLADNATAICLSSIKSIQLGGENLTPQLHSKLLEFTSAKIYNQYGPSEITACCTIKEIKKEINIGTPLDNTKIYILDTDLNLCPPGVIGEICIAGDGVSKGYINNPEMTKKAFINNPFGEGNLYKSGDLGTFTQNGEIEYIGRKDFQIKIRGLRVELSEIDNKFLEVDEINNSCVIYKQDEDDDYLVGFFTANSLLDTTDIRQHLSQKLPLYMVPKYIIQLDEMPINPNGKINRSELANRKIKSAEKNTYVEPETDLQKLFCNIWNSYLKIKVGIDDNIFELGVDSLIAIKFKTELLSHNINIPYANLFKYPTVRLLSENTTVQEEHMTFSKFDYTKINKILEKNNLETLKKNPVKSNFKNNILLLGSTGFVGSHILYNFIKQDFGTAYCIIRTKNNTNPKKRLLDTLHFYFGDELDSEIDKRIIIYEGDITKDNFALSPISYSEIVKNTSTVINSAAMVKHYGDINKFKNINISATEKLCQYCKNNNKKLIHLSTTSISETSNLDADYVATKKYENTEFSESNLYIGQILDNEYTRSKFEAERLILENMTSGLKAKIIRLGNITNRYSDGTFQLNPHENGFANRLKSFVNLKSVPDYLQALPLEFTPVDLCSKTIIYILQNEIKDLSVFHIYNHNYIYLKEVFDIMSNLDTKINFVPQNKFKSIIKNIIEKENSKDILSGVINDLNDNYELIYEKDIDLSSKLTQNFLSRLGFEWPKIDETYILKYINYMKKIEFFKEEK